MPDPRGRAARRVRRAAPLLALLGVLAAGCSSAPRAAAPTTFDEAAIGPACMGHQAKAPSPTEAAGRQLAKTLTVLRYYTAHGSQPYCDARAPSPVDLTWLRLYIRLGADRSHVVRWLPAA